MREFSSLMRAALVALGVVALGAPLGAGAAQAQYVVKPDYAAPVGYGYGYVPPPIYYAPPPPVYVAPPPRVYYVPPRPVFVPPPVFYAPRPYYGRPHWHHGRRW